MSRTKLKRWALFLGVFSLFPLLANYAHAGLTGCAGAPAPGSHLDCRLQGPFSPRANGGLSCITQCKALKTCLENNPNNRAVCNPEQAAMDACVATLRRNRALYTPGVGCQIERAVAVDTSISDEREVVLRTLRQMMVIRSNVKIADHQLDEAICEESSEPAIIIQTVVADVLNVSPQMVQRDTNFYEDLGATWEDMRVIADQLGMLTGVDIDDSIVDQVRTPRDIELCSRQINAKL
jgi:hypothetical protein